MFSRILIANRGEIALRILRACKEMGVQTVVVYSEADRDALYLRLADAAICIGPPPASESYLNIARIISAAEIADVDAIHPGYGFLAENAHFAEVCESCNIKFIGPSSGVMQKLGNKAEAIMLAKENKIPTLQGSEGILKNEREAAQIARKIGYPVMLKAAAGGGGRGMRIAHNEVSLIKSFHAAKAEADAAFGDGSLYLEKYIEQPRHVEIQVLADEHGNILHLGERDCTLQRRHQKLVEEAPSPAVSHGLREEMGRAAVRLMRAAGYTSAGTVEFLLDRFNNFYFIEVNTRVQVEHTITEMVTGLDIVKEQIRVAAGERLHYRQRHIRLSGTAIECRINAEDPENNFKPSPGEVKMYVAPGGAGVRVDSHLYPGYRVGAHYDSLIAKLIVHRRTRQEAIECMRRALDEYAIEGIKTTIPLCKEIFNNVRFIRGLVDTSFIESEFGTL